VTEKENALNKGMPIGPPFPTEEEKAQAIMQREILRKKQRSISNKNLHLVKPRRSRAVKNKTTGEEFNALQRACDKYNLDLGGLVRCCKGVVKTCGGFEWEYLSELPLPKKGKATK